MTVTLDELLLTVKNSTDVRFIEELDKVLTEKKKANEQSRIDKIYENAHLGSKVRVHPKHVVFNNSIGMIARMDGPEFLISLYYPDNSRISRVKLHPKDFDLL